MPLAAGILANFGLIVAGWFTRFVSYTLAKDNELLGLQVSRGVGEGHSRSCTMVTMEASMA